MSSERIWLWVRKRRFIVVHENGYPMRIIERKLVGTPPKDRWIDDPFWTRDGYGQGHSGHRRRILNEVLAAAAAKRALGGVATPPPAAGRAGTTLALAPPRVLT